MTGRVPAGAGWKCSGCYQSIAVGSTCMEQRGKIPATAHGSGKNASGQWSKAWHIACYQDRHISRRKL